MGLEKNNGDIDEKSLNPIYTYSFSVEPTSKKLSDILHQKSLIM